MFLWCINRRFKHNHDLEAVSCSFTHPAVRDNHYSFAPKNPCSHVIIRDKSREVACIIIFSDYNDHETAALPLVQPFLPHICTVLCTVARSAQFCEMVLIKKFDIYVHIYIPCTLQIEYWGMWHHWVWVCHSMFLCVIALLMKIIWYENHFTIVTQNYYSWLALHNSLYFDKLTIYVFS